MPTITTHRIGSFANGLVVGEIDLDEDLRIRKGRIINNSDKLAVFIMKKSGEVKFEYQVEGHETIEKNIPGTYKFLIRDYVPDDPDDEGTISYGDIELGMRWG